ncbi:MAG: PEP-CTERM sorting domain-containing protein [Planctomycetota bacterium]
MKQSCLVGGLAAAVFAGSADAAVIFSLADTSDALFTHSSSGGSPSPIPAAGSQSVGNGTFSWGDLATDGGGNTAEFASGAFTSGDFGGVGTFTSLTLDVSAFTEVDIDAVYDGRFNTASEFSNFFYVLDGTEVVFGEGVEDATADDVAVSIVDLDVTGASTLVVGFTFNHNGGSDFFNVDSLVVDAIPEPGSLVLMGLGSLLIASRRRKA